MVNHSFHKSYEGFRPLKMNTLAGSFFSHGCDRNAVPRMLWITYGGVGNTSISRQTNLNLWLSSAPKQGQTLIQSLAGLDHRWHNSLSTQSHQPLREKRISTTGSGRSPRGSRLLGAPYTPPRRGKGKSIVFPNSLLTQHHRSKAYRVIIRAIRTCF
jgi:hypothetical protein